MKRSIIVVVVTVSILSGCYQKNLGPKADVFENGAQGHWKLLAYSVRGQSKPVNDIPSKTLLNIERAVVKADSTYPSAIYQVGYAYRRFLFTDRARKETSKVSAISYDHDYSKKYKQETHWFRVDNEYGFQVILDVDLQNAKSTKMEMSNVMKSDVYQAELDTARYVYVADPQ